MEGKRLVVILLAVLLLLPAMAQSDSVTYRHHANMFPRLVLSHADISPSLSSINGMGNLSLCSSKMSLLMPPTSTSNLVDDIPQSVLIRQHPVIDSVEAKKVQYRYTPGSPKYEVVDNLKWLRNDIVFKRMKDRQKVLAPNPTSIPKPGSGGVRYGRRFQ